jgi:hypothetical protein
LLLYLLEVICKEKNVLVKDVVMIATVINQAVKSVLMMYARNAIANPKSLIVFLRGINGRYKCAVPRSC